MKKIFMLVFIFIVVYINAQNVWIVNTISENLTAYDMETGVLISQFSQLGQSPNSACNKLVVGDNKVYVTITYENSIQVINLENPDEKEYIFLENSSSPNDLCLHDNFLYVSGNDTFKLYKINLEDNSIQSVATEKSPESIFVYDNKIFVFCTGYDMPSGNYHQGNICVYDLNSFSRINTIQTNINPRSGLIVDDKLHLYCSGNYGDVDGSVQIFNLDDFSLVNQVTVEGTPLMGKIVGDNVVMTSVYPSKTHIYNKNSLEFIENNQIFDASILDVYGQYLVLVNPEDFINASEVKIYSTSNLIEPIIQFQANVGATDVKISSSQISSNDELILNNNFSVFPNPVKKQCNVISNNRNCKIKSLCLYNIKGQQILKKKNINDSNCYVCVENLKNGIYLLKIIDDNNNYQYKKIIKLK